MATVLGIWGAFIWRAQRRGMVLHHRRGHRVLDDLWSQGRPLHAVLLHDSGVFIPSRAIPHRHRRDAVPRGARRAGVAQADGLRKGPPSRTRFGETGLVFAVLFALAVADMYRAPLRMREAPPLPNVYRTLASLPRGPVIELPFWSDRIAYHRHAEYMLALDLSLAAADQRLQRSHSAGLSRQRAAAQQLSEPRFVRDPRARSARATQWFTSI